jgi:hypothetical protein
MPPSARSTVIPAPWRRQIPSGMLAVRLGGVRVLAAGTVLIAVGYGWPA